MENFNSLDSSKKLIPFLEKVKKSPDEEKIRFIGDLVKRMVIEPEPGQENPDFARLVLDFLHKKYVLNNKKFDIFFEIESEDGEVAIFRADDFVPLGLEDNEYVKYVIDEIRAA